MKIENFDHLVLLIGTNPLPNFVVADYFLQENPKLRTIWLLHSEKNQYQGGTLEFAENLEKLLWRRRLEETNRKMEFRKVPLSDVSDAQAIKRDIENNIGKKINKGEIIHLNYTGGTKSMSTHAYWVVREMSDTDTTTFSYLDGRNFRLVSDRKGILEGNLRRHVTATVKELVALHGFERKKGKESPFVFTDALQIFEGLIENGTTAVFYETDGFKREMFTDKKGFLAEKRGAITQENLEKLETFEPGELLLSINAAMPEDYRLFSAEGRFLEKITNAKFEAAVKFLDGFWLEEYVARALQPITDDHVTMEQNWNLLKPGWRKDMDFELDILLMNGYQLTGISCTTDDKRGLCKSKGFEVIHRTRQIGGGEARSVLITRLNPGWKKAVQEELLHETGGLLGNILVLGEKDLKKERLIDKIQEFVLE